MNMKADAERKHLVALISSIPPDPSRIAGALILSRWLDHPQIDWIYIEPPPKRRSLLWRLLDRLTRSRVHRIAHIVKRFYEGNALAVHLFHETFFRHCLLEVSRVRPGIILSVAHGPFYKVAHRVCKRTGVPLVLLVQDWWPAFLDLKPRQKMKEEEQFRLICADSAVTIAVSEGMLKELGNPPNALVLHDIPSQISVDLLQPFVPSRLPLNVIYAGNLSTYGPMVEQAALACMGSDLVRMEIYGREPIRWSEGIQTRFEEAGVFRGFVSPEIFPQVASNYDCILAIMSFAPALRQRMRTCFLSKLIELAQLGKPIVIWSPQDGSAAVWARKTGAALCVTEEDPRALLQALENLAKDEQEQIRIVESMKTIRQNEFNPVKIREKFMSLLASVDRYNLSP